MNFQNTMHIIVTVIVVFTTILSFYMLAIGYLRKEKFKAMGNISLTVAILITLFGAMNPIGMAAALDILGLTERLVIFTARIRVFLIFYLFI